MKDKCYAPQLCENLRKKCEAFREVDGCGFPIFTDYGKTVWTAYRYLFQSLGDAESAEEFVESVAQEISWLAGEFCEAPMDSSAKSQVSDLMARYVRHNVDKKFWENIPEFSREKEGEA